MLDLFTPAVRHLCLMLLAALLTWASQEFVPHLTGIYGAAAGTLVAILLAWVTPLTRQYGVGSPSPDNEGR